MKKKSLLIGLLAIVLAFVIAVIGCDILGDDNDVDNGESNDGSGVNLGIVAFGDSRTVKPIQLLTSRNSYQFHNFIGNLSMEDGTGLYLAVDEAITMLTNASLPNDLSSVAIVTFTDGLDNVSLHNPHSSHAAWRDHLSKRITDTKVNGLSINAYSIGIRGTDVTDTANFTAGLKAIASTQDNVSEVTDMTAVTARFKEIADSLYQSNTSHSISLRIPIGYESGATIRFTFDIAYGGNVDNSNLYIEGIFTVDNGVFSLTNVTQQGLTHNSGVSITGNRSGNFVTFAFNNIQGTSGSGSIDVSNTRHWFKNPGQSELGPNVEFNPNSDSETNVKRSSAVIMLVLDRTTSLGEYSFGSMKSAAIDFVDILATDNDDDDWWDDWWWW